MRAIFAVFLLSISVFIYLIFLSGSHGHIQFRPHMTEDWVFWSLTIIPAIVGAIILFRIMIQRFKK